ncbi:MAG TPA: alanine:cation symporter family protein [Thiothrix sp.]|nr:alanine:cation symporter family protein [Thiothrix sp.]
MTRSPIPFSLGLFLLLLTMPVFAAEDGGGLNAFVGTLNGYIGSVLFFDVFPGEGDMPFIVAWLIVGAVFLTLRFGFINLRMMGHAFNIIRGKYNDKDAKGEVTPFQALTTALSATVGLGNIAGVAIAIIIGGPGAIVWMIIAGFFGMTSKFTEVTLAQKYRRVRADGRIMGGAMEYLSQGLAEKNLPTLGKVLAIMFAILTIGGSLGAGNAFQVSQAVGAIRNEVPFFDGKEWILGLFFATLVGVVIIGGLRRIAQVAEMIVPTMVIVYISACLWIILSNIGLVPDALGTIWQSAFTLEAGIGGLIGVIVQGFKRAVFSSEAGIGSAAIAHSAACVKHPVRQGFVALYEPFIDTIVICTMTALVIVITGVYSADEFAALREAKDGAALTAEAFGTAISWFPIILSLSVVLFAFSTMISWSYYGERCWSYVFGDSTSMIYRVIFVAFVMVGATVSAGNILDFSDLLILAMAFPNFIGLYLLSGKVAELLKDYHHRLQRGELG